ncbi:MAG: ATP-binding protein [Planctomycetota bacterium]
MSGDFAPIAAPPGEDLAGLGEVVRSFPAILETLRRSYAELEERAARVENELYHANRELARRVAELDVLKRHLEAVLESLPCGVVVRDGAGRVVRANGTALAILGVPADELIGRSDPAALRNVRSDGQERELHQDDGRRLVVAASCSRVRLANGRAEGSVEILDDRTERTALIEKLHAADKMAALGTMAGGIAHEIRNPLSAVRGFAGLLRESAGLSEQARRWTSLIVAGVDEADEIIQNMLSFGSPERLRLAPVDGTALLAEAVRLAVGEEGRTPAGTELTLNVQAAAPVFAGDQIKLRQAIRNLVANAATAQPDGGRIDVDLRLSGGDIVVTVSDAGPGIPAGERHRVLDPFYTTHADGTGLGLALVATIARLHGGDVEVSPRPSALGGAEIRLHIPYQPAVAPAPTTDSPNH